MSDFKYRPDVDGLRAVAVLLVLFFHAGLGFSGGYIGVDIFFVISGYLITGLVLKEQHEETFRLSTFWQRRIRRIVPAALVMACGTLILGYAILLPPDYAELGQSTIAQQLMVANVYFWRNTGYFAGPAELKPLLHTWSLAVEEQFYLGYPFLLLLLRRRSTNFRATILSSIAVASFVLSLYLTERSPSAAFYLLPDRIWELLLGGMIWFARPPTTWSPTFRTAASWGAVVALLAAALFYKQSTPFPGYAALLPCGAAALFIYLNSDTPTSPARWLARKPVVYIGLMSYSLYLWHWPLLALARYWWGRDLTLFGAVGVVAASVPVAWLSYQFVETPFRKKSWLPTPSPLIATAVTAAAATCLFGFLVSRDGVANRFSPDVLAITQVKYLGYGVSGSLQEGWTAPRVGAGHDNHPQPTFMIWGDSHAKVAGLLADEIASRQGISGYCAGKGATPPLLGAWTRFETAAEPTAFNEWALEFAHAHGVKWLILISAWDSHANGHSGLVDGTTRQANQALAASFERTLHRAEKLGLRIAVVMQPPYQGDSVPLRVARDTAYAARATSFGVSRQEYDQFSQPARAFFAQFENRILILDNVERLFDEQGRSIIGKNRIPYYCDDNHLTRDGARIYYEPLLNNFFAQLAKEQLSFELDSPRSSTDHPRRTR